MGNARGSALLVSAGPNLFWDLYALRLRPSLSPSASVIRVCASGLRRVGAMEWGLERVVQGTDSVGGCIGGGDC